MSPFRTAASRMPRPVGAAIFFLLASMLPGWLSPLDGTAATVRLITSLFVTAMALAAAFRINTVRIILVILLAFGTGSLISQRVAGGATSPISIVVTMVQLISTVLLFTPPARSWFRPHRTTRSD
jgi:hypothetical protein